ncbi:MAG: ABC transporter ATP-binding protein [marine bacterium B5-7]|nr:MAG: ABC transporter ATP-binding protein [marine bacterium B5-7]
MNDLLTVENLNVDFLSGLMRVEAVRNVSFTVAPSEILGIVGESGSGKSVSCRAVLGLLPGHARVNGRIIYDGKDLGAMSANELSLTRGRDISMIFQNPSSHLDPLMTIGDHVAEPLHYHFGLDKKNARIKALELLDVVKIQNPEQRYTAYPHELSGGMKQRVLIASALACQPRMLLADEPTTALDVTVQASILELLKSLNRDHGLSMIFVSHDLGVIAEICDRVVVMRGGEIVEQGSVNQVVGNPQHEYTRLLIGSQPGRLDSYNQPSHEGHALLEIEQLSVRFNDKGGLGTLLGGRSRAVNALDNININIRSGETFGIVGESGSGKSTIARAVVRLIEATSGAIVFQGKLVGDLKGLDLVEYRRQVQMIFQNPYDSLNPRASVRQTIAEPIWRHGLATQQDANERAIELMAMVELSENLANRRPRQLSGGQCQRVAIARALALSPRLLIADEVTSALDVTIQAQVLKLLARLKDSQDLTIIYISHDLAVVRKFCDRVAVLRHGKLIETGLTDKVFDQPANDYTRTLIDAAPELDSALLNAAAL